jgi:hypothetical protein
MIFCDELAGRTDLWPVSPHSSVEKISGWRPTTLFEDNGYMALMPL